MALALAGLLTLAALTRPLGPGHSPRVRLLVTLILGLGVAGSALLASLRGRGQAEQLAFYAFLVLSLDALGQILSPLGWPMWPLMVLLVGAVAVAEALPLALGLAALASLLATADVAASSFAHWKPAAAASLGYGALVLALNRALLGEKQRLSRTLAELARLRHGIGHLEDAGSTTASLRPTTASFALREVSEEGRRVRQLDRAAELDEALARLVRVARGAIAAHAVLYFDLDREREVALLRASDGPPELLPDPVIPLSQDPFAFVLDRGRSFYATDFPRLLWALPYYKGAVKVGTLIALPVRMADVILGLLVADRLEIQCFTEHEPALLDSFAEMAAEAIQRMRASSSREELGVEFKAVYPLSSKLAASTESGQVRRLLLQSARDLVPVEGAAVVMTDEAQTRYVIENASGWAAELEGREVGLSEKTWAAWIVRSAEEAYLLENAEDEERMPFLVLDEGTGRAESLLAFPLRARDGALGAFLLTGRRGAFNTAAKRVLGILANQAAAALSTIQLMERIRDMAVRDGLTGLYNRRAFGDLLAQARAREERQGGRFAVLLLDIDYFKRLNDTFGHPAGDAALRNAAQTLERHLRKGDQAARYGGEEFAAILPGADEQGALHLAERVRGAIERGQIVFEGARLSVTASFGAAVWPSDGKDAEALLAAADRALYAAKAAGRNRVVAASSLPQPAAAPTSS